MKKITLSLMAALVAVSGMAQVQIGKDFSLKIYGHVRTDIYYNSRDNVQSVDGLFYSYPKDEVLDGNGNDINGSDNSNMYAVYSRMGFDFAGPMIGKAKTSAKIEFDFRGNGNDNLSALRLRHAYFNFDWGKNKVFAPVQRGADRPGIRRQVHRAAENHLGAGPIGHHGDPPDRPKAGPLRQCGPGL